MLSESTAPKFSEIERAPVQTIAFVTDAVRVSVSPLNPVMSLVALSERADAKSSDMVRAPVKTLDTESEMEDRSSGEILASTARRVTVSEVEAAGLSVIEAT